MPSVTRPDWSGRLKHLQREIVTRDVEAFVVSTGVNIFYLCGFSGSAGLLVVTGESAVLIVDGRYQVAVAEGLRHGSIAAVTPEPVAKRYDLTLGELLVRQGLRRVAFEAAQVTVATLGAWQRAAPGLDWRPTERIVELRRMVKDDFEIGILRRGGQLIAGVAEDLRRIVTAGRTEQDIADAIEAALRLAGFERTAFPTIVASGPNSALPHARPTTRRLSAGDLVLLDFGGVLDGYCVDLTRMAAIGPVSAEATRLYATVLEAEMAAVAAVRPGVPASSIDQAARDVCVERGLGQAFVHATGHGLGLDVHEAPRVGRADDGPAETVEAGMVFTIEPGAYLQGIGGARLEDDVLVTAEGCDVLTESTRDLIVV